MLTHNTSQKTEEKKMVTLVEKAEADLESAEKALVDAVETVVKPKAKAKAAADAAVPAAAPAAPARPTSIAERTALEIKCGQEAQARWAANRAAAAPAK
jgi:hypothetical protein